MKHRPSFVIIYSGSRAAPVAAAAAVIQALAAQTPPDQDLEVGHKLYSEHK